MPRGVRKSPEGASGNESSTKPETSAEPDEKYRLIITPEAGRLDQEYREEDNYYYVLRYVVLKYGDRTLAEKRFGDNAGYETISHWADRNRLYNEVKLGKVPSVEIEYDNGWGGAL